jgi:hypothetical protein
MAARSRRRPSGRSPAQRSRGFEWQKAQHPAIAAVMSGIRRRNGTAPAQKAPVVDQELVALVATLDRSLRGLRDRALLTMVMGGSARSGAPSSSCSPSPT